jgi:hypothetical protein
VIVAIRVLGSTIVDDTIVTPPPLTETVVAPLTKFLPSSVRLSVVPATAVSWDRDVSAGSAGDGCNSVNVCEPEVPACVVTVIARGPAGADGSMVTGVVRIDVPSTFTGPTVTPGPVTVTTPPYGTRFAPFSVSVNVLPTTPLAGETAMSIGRSSGRTSKKINVCDEPVVNVNNWSPISAPASIVIVAVNAVGLETWTSFR